MKKPKHYRPDVGDEFIAIRNLTSAHRGRVFEARDQRTGEGILGYLDDANHYLLDDTVAIRFRGEALGIFDVPDALILMKPEGFVLPEAAPSE